MHALHCFLLAWAFRASLAADFNEEKFPDDFVFGVATSAYQTEGAWNVDGKGANIWDVYLHNNPDFVYDGSNGDIACDSYNKFREDVALVKELGVDYYRFSLSWSRILPQGFSHQINPDGIRFYNSLIDELLANGIKPMVTLYHGDLPQSLLDIGGLTNPHFADYFADFAKVAFENFGDRVKYWVTINEPCLGYADTDNPPALGLSGIADYLCLQVTLLGHAKIYHLYQDEFKAKQNGSIGLTISANWVEPATSSSADEETAERVREFLLGHYLQPLFGKTGDFPEVMKDRVAFRSSEEGFAQSRLPAFSEEEVAFIKGSSDFVGINHYTTMLVGDAAEKVFDSTHRDNDMKAWFAQDPSWEGGKSYWLKVVPWGFRKTLNWVKDKYDNPPIIVTENGFSDDGELDDMQRVNYYTSYLSALLDAIHTDGVNVKGYFAWSLLDNFEWRQGYRERFGLVHVDFNDPNRKRTPKTSAKFYREVTKHRKLVPFPSDDAKIEL